MGLLDSLLQEILLVSWLQCFRHDAYQGENFNWEGNRD